MLKTDGYTEISESLGVKSGGALDHRTTQNKRRDLDQEMQCKRYSTNQAVTHSSLCWFSLIVMEKCGCHP